MAIYHLHIESVSRGEGRCATAASAYRAAERIHDLETDEVFDYPRKRGVEHTEIIVSRDATRQDINWARNRQDLWNAAEGAEKRKDARIAREYELSLPCEMSAPQRLVLTRAFAQELADRYQCAVDLAIHRPHRHGDKRNHHAHLLTTTRQIAGSGLGSKTEVEWSNADRRKHGLQSASAEMKEIRARWEVLANEHLHSLGIDAHIDHRSLKDQGIEREPTVHQGPAVHAMEQRGIETEVGFRLQDQARERLERAQELGRLEREAQQLTHSVLVLDQDIQAALAAREGLALERSSGLDLVGTAPSGLVLEHDPEALRQAARARWLAYHRQHGSSQKGPEPTHDLATGSEPDDLEARHQKKKPTHRLEGPDNDLSLQGP